MSALTAPAAKPKRKLESDVALINAKVSLVTKSCEKNERTDRPEKKRKRAKKPMTKLGSWRGAFAGTPDF